MDMMEDVSKHAQGIEVFYEAGRRYGDTLTWIQLTIWKCHFVTVIARNNLYLQNYGVSQLRYMYE